MNPPTPPVPTPPGAGDVPMTDTRALCALWVMYRDVQVVRTVVRTWRRWSELAAAPRSELAVRLGAARAALMVPPVCPTPDTAGGRLRVLGRFDPGFPRRVAVHPDTPPVLWWAGTTPDPLSAPVLVCGPEHPAPGAGGTVDQVVRAVVGTGTPVMTVAAPGVCTEVADRAADWGARPLVMVPGGAAPHPTGGPAFDRILAAGGTVMSPHPPGSPLRGAGDPVCALVAAAWASMVVLVDYQPHVRGGAVIVDAARAAGTPVLVCVPDTARTYAQAVTNRHPASLVVAPGELPAALTGTRRHL